MSQKELPAKFIKKLGSKVSKSYSNQIPIIEPYIPKIHKYRNQFDKNKDGYCQVNKE